jgi:ribosome-associated toxin RatA of RatAB toxin-antitoxin module
MYKYMWLCSAMMLALFWFNSAFADEIKINFVRDGDLIKIDGHLLLPYSPKLVWDVLTDYEHMHEYVPDMTSSRVIKHDGNKLQVEQKGRSGIGPFKFKFELVREVELIPMSELKSVLVSGNFKSMRTATTLVPDGDKTRLDYIADMEPDFWVPPLIGSAIMKRQVRRQFEAFIDELSKRSRATSDVKKIDINQ